MGSPEGSGRWSDTTSAPTQARRVLHLRGAGMDTPRPAQSSTRDNVFERGSNRTCAAYGPVTNFDASAPGNVWSLQPVRRRHRGPADPVTPGVSPGGGRRRGLPRGLDRTARRERRVPGGDPVQPRFGQDAQPVQRLQHRRLGAPVLDYLGRQHLAAGGWPGLAPQPAGEPLCRGPSPRSPRSGAELRASGGHTPPAPAGRPWGSSRARRRARAGAGRGTAEPRLSSGSRAVAIAMK